MYNKHIVNYNIPNLCSNDIILFYSFINYFYFLELSKYYETSLGNDLNFNILLVYLLFNSISLFHYTS